MSLRYHFKKDFQNSVSIYHIFVFLKLFQQRVVNHIWITSHPCIAVGVLFYGIPLCPVSLGKNLLYRALRSTKYITSFTYLSKQHVHYNKKSVNSSKSICSIDLKYTIHPKHNGRLSSFSPWDSVIALAITSNTCILH